MQIDLTPPVALPVPFGLDASTSDPFWTDDNSNNLFSMQSPDKIGFPDIPVYRWVPERELMSASFTPFGQFICSIAVELTLKDMWEYTDPRDKDEAPNDSVMKRLETIDNQLDVKSLAVEAITLARRLHRSALFRIVVGKQDNKPIFIWRVSRIPDEWVTHDNEAIPQGMDPIPPEEQTGEIIEIHPIIKWGKGQKQFSIPKEDFVIFVNRRDPAGNGWQGIPELIAVYRVLKWDQNVLKAFDKTIWQRGVGILDATVKGAKNDADLQKWEQKYGNPSQYASIWHTERMELKAIEGIKPNYNIGEVADVHRHYTSAGSGMPGERMIGVQTGAVTGSETDQDNMAEIYRTITDVHDEFIKKIYEIIDPSLENKFGLKFPINVRMDAEREAGVLSTNTRTVVESGEFMKVSIAETKLGYEVTDKDEEKQMYFAEFLDERAKARGLPTEKEEIEMEQERQDQQFQQKQQQFGGKQQSSNNKKPNNQERKQEKDSLIDGLRDTFPDKLHAADWLLNTLNASYDVTNGILQPLYGEGCSYTTLAAIKQQQNGG